jgi:hypothetical protein
MRIILNFGKLEIEDLEANITPSGDEYILSFVATPGNPARINLPHGLAIPVLPWEGTPATLRARREGTTNLFTALEPTGSFIVASSFASSDYFYPTNAPRLVCRLFSAQPNGLSATSVGITIEGNILPGFNNKIRFPNGDEKPIQHSSRVILQPTFNEATHSFEGILVLNNSFLSSAEFLANKRGRGIFVEFKTRIQLRGDINFVVSIKPSQSIAAPEVNLIAEIERTDPAATYTITDVGIKTHPGRGDSSFPIRKLMVDSAGVRCEFQSRAAFSQGSSGAPIPDHKHEVYSVTSDESLFVRPYHGEIFFAFKDVENPFGQMRAQTVLKDAASDIPTKIPAGDAWVRYEGEVYNIKLLDGTNCPSRIYSDRMLLINPVYPAEYRRGVSFAYSASDHAFDYYQTGARVNQEAHGSISFGDLQLMLSDGHQTPIVFRSRTFTAPTGDGLWAFPIAQAVKTPFRGDAPSKKSETSRREVYSAAPGKDIVFFKSNGTPTVRNILQDFRIADSNDIDCSQPQNLKIQFREGTRLIRLFSGVPLTGRKLMEAASVGTSTNEDDVKYSSVDADLKIGRVPNPKPDNKGNYEVPTFTWKESLATPISNTELARDWINSVPSDRAEYEGFVRNFNLAKNSLPLGYGWATEPSASIMDGPQVVKLDLRKNYPNNIPLPPAIKLILADETPKKFQFQRVERDSAGNPIPIGGLIEIKSWWRHIFLQTELHPGKIGWSGLVVGRTPLLASPNMPENMRKLIKRVPLIVGWFDGLGATAVCDFEVVVDENDPHFDPDRELTVIDTVTQLEKTVTLRQFLKKTANDDNHYMALTDFQMVIHKSQVERLSFTYYWEMPLFDRDRSEKRQFIKIRGQWGVPEDGGEKRLIISASLPDKDIKVGWLGIEKVTLKDITFTYVQNASGASRWKLDLDGDIDFDAQTVRTWFADKLKGLKFSRWQLDFENPFGKWNVPSFQLKNKIDLSIKGFDFRLSSFKIPSHPRLGGRRLELFGGLKFGIPSGFIKNADIDLSLNFDLPNIGNLGAFSIAFGDIDLRGLDINLFNFIQMSGQAKWENDEFSGNAKITWSWAKNKPNTELDVFFRFSGKKGRSFWLAGVALKGPDGQEKEFDLGVVKAEGVHLIAGHKASRPGLREAVLSVSAEAFKGKFLPPSGTPSGEWMDSWEYEPAYDFLVGAHFKRLRIAGDAIDAKDLTLIFCDDGIFRLEADLRLFSVDISKAMIAVDWKRQIIAASLALPKFDYGAYSIDLGSVGLVIGDGIFQTDIGFPHNLDWSRAIKVHWTPTPWPVPINEVQGGFLFGIKLGEGLTLAAAARAGYTFMLGSDGGAFGAFISGSIFLGGIVIGRIGSGMIEQTGIMTLDASARGGLVVFGLRWDILSVELHAALIERLVIRNGSMSLSFGAEMYAGFSVCLTPCTCFSGSVKFSYGCNTTSQTGFQVSSSTEADQLVARSALDEAEQSLEEIIAFNLITHHQYKIER